MNAGDIKDIGSSAIDIIKGFKDLFDKDDHGKFEVFEALKNFFVNIKENFTNAFAKPGAEGAFSSTKTATAKEI